MIRAILFTALFFGIGLNVIEGFAAKSVGLVDGYVRVK